MPKIMLVEDDNNLREIYGERLMAEGYEIVSASDGEEALALAVKEKPDLIISDVMMPKISGFDMLDILRQTPETKSTKVIMMTALSQTEDKDRADKLGADKYLVKSQVTLEDVARVVHDLVYGPDDTPGAEASAGPETATQEPAVVAPVPQSVVMPVLETAPPIATPEPLATPEEVAPVATVPAFDIESMVVTPIPTEQPMADNPFPPAPEANDNEGEPVVLPPAPAAAINPVAEPVIAAPIPTAQDITVPDLSTTAPAVTAVTENTGTVTAPVAIAEPVAAAPTVSVVTEPATVPIAATATTSPEPIMTSAPVAAAVPTIPVFNPILGDTPEPTTAMPAVGSAEAQTTADETAQIAQQIQNFISAQPDASAQHEAPLVEPTEQELIHAQNAVEEPEVLQPAVDAGITNQATATPADPTVPQVVPVNVDSLEPASARKKVISPINDPSNMAPNIYELYEKEIAEEAANSPIVNPSAGTSVDADTNPIVGALANAPTAALETIDLSQIEGVTVGEEQPLPPLPEPRTMAQVPETPQAPVSPESNEESVPDPNDPNSFAL